MSTLYCPICGTRLEKKECKGEKELIPYCPHCQEYRFETFSAAIITAVLNKEGNKVLLMRQYGRKKYNLLAGYIDKGENAEDALKREMKEEMKMTPIRYQYEGSSYFGKTNTLMMSYISQVDNNELSGASDWEIDEARWCNWDEAQDLLIKGGVAAELLPKIKDRIK